MLKQKRKPRIATSYRDQLIGFVKAYRKKHPGPVSLYKVAVWAYEKGLWEPRRIHPATILAK